MSAGNETGDPAVLERRSDAVGLAETDRTWYRDPSSGHPATDSDWDQENHDTGSPDDRSSVGVYGTGNVVNASGLATVNVASIRVPSGRYVPCGSACPICAVTPCSGVASHAPFASN